MSTGGALTAEVRETARIEAFSDGVFAIAVTLLVLNLQVPHNMREDRELLRALLNQWPSYLAYVTSFTTISIMWINHLVGAITRGYSYGPPVYLLTFALAFISVPASVTMNLVLAVFWALPSQNPFVRRKASG